MSAGRDAAARIWDVHDSDRRLRFEGNDEWTGREISHDGSMIAVVRGRRVDVHDIATGELINSISGPELWPGAASFTADGRRLIIHTATERQQWTGDGAIFDVLTGRRIAELHDLRTMPPVSPSEPLVNAQGFHEAVFSPSGDRIAVRALGWKTVVYDWRSGEKLRSLVGHTDGVRSVQFSPDGSRILSLSTDGTARSWDAENGDPRHTYEAGGPVFGARYSRNGRYLLTLTDSGSIAVWRTSDGSNVSKAELGDPPAGLLALSDNGRDLVVRDAEGVRVIATATGWTVARINLSRPDSAIRLSPDAARMACISADRQIELWDTRGGNQVLTLRGHEATPGLLGFALGGSAIVAGDRYATHVWDARGSIERSESVRRFIERKRSAEPSVHAAVAQSPEPDRVRANLLGTAPRTDLPSRALAAAVTSVLIDRDSVGIDARRNAGMSATAAEVAEAMEEAETAGNSSRAMTRLGVALYRDGQYERALAALRRSERLIDDDHPSAGRTLAFHSPENGGHIAMALWRLGMRDEALDAVESLREVIAEEHTDCECFRHLDAALAVVSSESGGTVTDGAIEYEESK